MLRVKLYQKNMVKKSNRGIGKKITVQARLSIIDMPIYTDQSTLELLGKYALSHHFREIEMPLPLTSKCGRA
jgi:hypothetical protein